MNSSHILEHLNPEQKEAVCAPRSNILVLAGAGSGKTRVLIHRIAWLVEEENVSLYNIMGVTFTNKAASEIRSRAQQLLQKPTRNLWLGTFHSIAHRILRYHSKAANLSNDFEIIDVATQLRMVRKIILELNIDLKTFPPRRATSFINDCKDEGQRARHKEAGGNFNLERLIRIYTEYEDRCKKDNLVDFAELLLRAHELWLEREDILTEYQERFQDLLVDEFQDTNSIQYAWLRMLAGREGKSMFVGDDDQSIYGWRGAKMANMFAYEKDYSDVKTIRLEQNYRSTGRLLKAANAVIENNKVRKKKKLWTEAEDGAAIHLYEASDEVSEARFVAERIKSWQAEDETRKLANIAVFYRANAQSQVIEDAMMSFGLPYKIRGNLSFYERMEIKDILAYMRLLVNKNSDNAMNRVINTPPRRIGQTSLNIINQVVDDLGCSMWEASEIVQEQNKLPTRTAQRLEKFCQKLQDVTAKAKALNLADIANLVINQFDLKEFHGKGSGEVALARVENLKELISACNRYQQNSFNETETGLDLLQNYLDEVTLGIDSPTDENADALQLMTLHTSKGLEFPLVFMVGMEEGVFPRLPMFNTASKSKIEAELEEERRLCYVGITRAMQMLYMTYARSRRVYGRETYNKRSFFITEIPTDLLTEVRYTAPTDSEYTAPSNFAKVRKTPTPIKPRQFRIGQSVIHPKFGKGTLTSIDGKGEDTKVQVRFCNDDQKWLLLSYSKLQKAD